MKNKRTLPGVLKLTLAVTLVFALAVLSLTGCDTGGGGEGGNPIVISRTLGGGNMLSVNASVQKLSDKAQSGNSRDSDILRAVTVNTGGQQFRGEVQKDNSITGKLQDGADIYQLNGSYNPSNKAFTMQAASGAVVFSIDGKLNSGNNVAANESKAFLYVKDGAEWKTYEYAITSGNQTIDADVNQSGGEEIPAWGRGKWYDQITGTGIEVIGKCIWLSYPLTITILEAETVGAAVKLLVSGHLYGSNITYTARFYCANSYDATLSVLGSDSLPSPYDSFTVQNMVDSLPDGQKVFVVPYCSNDGTKVRKTGLSVYDYIIVDGYSPMFYGSAATANAKAATALKIIPEFTFALMKRPKW